MAKKNEPREYRFLDPEELDTSEVGHIEGTYAECLADALLDIIQLSLASGMTESDVDEALLKVEQARADMQRAKFTLHIKEDE